MHIAVERVVNASGHVFEAGQVFLCERFRVHIVLRRFDFRARYERRIGRNELPALPLPFALQIFVLTDSPQLVELGEAFGVPMISAPPRVEDSVGRSTLYQVSGFIS